MKILFVASEGLPFSKTGGLADVVEALPKALVAMGHEVSVVLPRYRNTKASAVVLPSLTIPTGDPVLRGVPVVFTIHNMGYHGLYPREALKRLGLPEKLFHMDAMEFYGKVNFLKGALVFADYLTTVSRKYAQEIQTPEYGHGLEGVTRQRAEHLYGILNGVDYSAWNPETDTFIAARYSARDLSGKQVCKRDLLVQFGLPVDTLGISRPLIGIVSRFADQKGFDLIAQVANELLSEDLSIVALGAGEPKHEQLFRELATRFPGKIGVKIAYDNAVAHKIEAGSDMFLMPSRYEPCGLNQIYSLKYGTVPVVRATGGLDDTIEPFDARTGYGTGFKFEAYSGQALLACLRQALRTFHNEKAWRQIQANGMAKDFSWHASAAEYVRLYESARKARNQMAAGTSN